MMMLFFVQNEVRIKIQMKTTLIAKNAVLKLLKGLHFVVNAEHQYQRKY